MNTLPTPPRPWFGVLSALFGVFSVIAPVILLCFRVVWDAIADKANPSDSLLFALLMLGVLPLLGMILALVALVRGERWRRLAITGLVGNTMLLILLVLAAAAWLGIRNTKIV